MYTYESCSDCHIVSKHHDQRMSSFKRCRAVLSSCPLVSFHLCSWTLVELENLLTFRDDKITLMLKLFLDICDLVSMSLTPSSYFQYMSGARDGVVLPPLQYGHVIIL